MFCSLGHAARQFRTEVSLKAVSTRDLANAIQLLPIDALEAANSGHPGVPMGMADASAVLFSRHLKFDASSPGWADRDRFVLSDRQAQCCSTGYCILPVTRACRSTKFRIFASGARRPVILSMAWFAIIVVGLGILTDLGVR